MTIFAIKCERISYILGEISIEFTQLNFIHYVVIILFYEMFQEELFKVRNILKESYRMQHNYCILSKFLSLYL